MYDAEIPCPGCKRPVFSLHDILYAPLDGTARCRVCGRIARLDLFSRWMISCAIAVILPALLLLLGAFLQRAPFRHLDTVHSGDVAHSHAGRVPDSRARDRGRAHARRSQRERRDSRDPSRRGHRTRRAHGFTLRAGRGRADEAPDVQPHAVGGGARLRLGPRRPTEQRETKVSLRNLLSLRSGARLRLGLRRPTEQKETKVSLRNLLSLRSGARLRLGLRHPTEQRQPMVSLRNLLSLRSGPRPRLQGLRRSCGKTGR